MARRGHTTIQIGHSDDNYRHCRVAGFCHGAESNDGGAPMIDIRIPVSTSKAITPLHDYTIDIMWYIPPTWPRDWEWRYDFPDIWRDLRRTINRWARAVWVQAARWVGYRVRVERPGIEVVTTYIPVKDIREAVSKLPWVQSVMREPIMVVVGMEEYRQIARLEQEFLGLKVSFEAGYGPNMFIFSIPVILSRLHSGMVILPDMTKTCSFRLIETDERRYDMGASMRRFVDPQEYMPRWGRDHNS